MGKSPPNEIITAIRDSIKSCRSCNFHMGRTQAVPPAGTCSNGIAFISDYPGRYEDESGKPFMGPAGKFLKYILSNEICLSLQDCLFTNVLKCKPQTMAGQQSRVQATHLNACKLHLLAELKGYNPKTIIALGRYSIDSLIERKYEKRPISELIEIELTTKKPYRCKLSLDANLFVLYNPVWVLRNEDDPTVRQNYIESMEAIIEMHNKLYDGTDRPYLPRML